MTAADRADLLDLWVRAWTRAWPSLDFEARRAWLSGHLDDLLADGAVLLIARDGSSRPTGFLTLHPATGEVDQLAVDPAQGGQGLGAALLAEAKRRAPGRLRLTVNQGNDRAVALYARAGFTISGEGVNPRSGLPVWVMEWRALP